MQSGWLGRLILGALGALFPTLGRWLSGRNPETADQVKLAIAEKDNAILQKQRDVPAIVTDADLLRDAEEHSKSKPVSSTSVHWCPGCD